jgi:hypothetical protein
MVKKGLDLFRAHVARMRHFVGSTVPENEKPHPVEIGFFSAEAIVQIPDPLPNLV